MDVVFVHGLCGGPFKTWRVADDSKEEGSRCWPESYLQTDLPSARTLTIKYKVQQTLRTVFGGSHTIFF